MCRCITQITLALIITVQASAQTTPTYTSYPGTHAKGRILPQSLSHYQPRDIRCATMEMDSIRRAHGLTKGSIQDFETWISTEIAKQSQQQQQAAPPIYTIPVVVHVLHNGDAVGSNENISQAQVNSQITVLNEDYRRTNADASNTPAVFQSVAADAEIEFCLAQVDPGGSPMPEPGIDRVDWTTLGTPATAPFSMTDMDNYIKPATSWNPNNYMNIWVVDLSGGILGYAQFPSNSTLSGLSTNGGAANTDGVVIGYQYFGSTPANPFPSSYNLGRTATHEIGHWLGLRHIWGDANCATDYCADTPTADQSHYGCPSHPYHVNQCGNGSSPNGEMFMNYMDYTDDGCMNMFSTDQRTRMRTVMQVATRRASLLNSTVCNSSAPPVANFTSNVTTVVQGCTIDFQDMSSGAPNSWSWTFGGGGTPNTSTQQNPTITWNTPGTYSVTLTATNANGTDTYTANSYVVVVPPQDCDTLNWPALGTPALYGSNNGGYVSGNNGYGDVSKAEYFSNYCPYAEVHGVMIWFGAATNTTGANVTVNMWDNSGPGGSPGTVITSQTVSLAQIVSDVSNSFYTIVRFPTPGTITGPFYIGVVLPDATQGDTVAIVTNTSGDTNPATAWEEWSGGGGWYAYDDASGWGLGVAHMIHALVSNNPAPTAAMTPTSPGTCTGGSITFDASSSSNATSYYWNFNGGAPATGNTVSQAVTYASSGTYSTTLYVQGACYIDSTTVTVNVGNLSTSNITQNASCAGNDGQATVSATGGNTPYTYNWSSGGTLATETGLSAGTYYCTITDNGGCSNVETVTIASSGGPTTSNTAQDATCGNNNGQATVTATGGTPPYTYAWSSGGSSATETGLAAGSYTCTVTDNGGCTSVQTIIINNTGGPTTTSSTIANVSCNGGNDGSAMASATGGTPPYTYNWSSGGSAATESMLAAGTYTCTITDAGGCSSVETVTVTEPSVLTLSATTTDETCGQGNGTATATASGGTPAYTYLWSNSGITATISGLTAGSYSCTVTDNNGCTSVQTVTVNNSGSMSATASSADASCANSCDGTATASGSGGTPPYTFAWSNGNNTQSVSNLCAGTYSVTVSDAGGCSNVQTVTVTAPSALSGSTTSTDENCGAGDGQATANISGGTTPYSYQWSNGGNTAAITGLSAGTYMCTVTDGNGCTTVVTAAVNNSGAPTANVTPPQTICSGDNTVITASGAGTGGSYAWSTGDITASITVMPTVTTTYTVTVTNSSGCTDVTSTTVSVQSAPTTTVTSSADTICAGSPVTLTAGGGSTYNWNTGSTSQSIVVNPTATTTYFVVAYNGNCPGNQASITVYIDPLSPSATGSATPNPVYLSNGGTANFSSTGSVGTSWTWDYNGDGIIDDNNTDGQFTYSSSGTYQAILCVTLGNCYVCDTIVVHVYNVEGISGVLGKQAFRMYPNPAHDRITFEWNPEQEGVINISLYDALGRLTAGTQINNQDRTQLDISNLAGGVYMVRISSGKGNYVLPLSIVK